VNTEYNGKKNFHRVWGVKNGGEESKRGGGIKGAEVCMRRESEKRGQKKNAQASKGGDLRKIQNNEVESINRGRR